MKCHECNNLTYYISNRLYLCNKCYLFIKKSIFYKLNKKLKIGGIKW